MKYLVYIAVREDTSSEAVEDLVSTEKLDATTTARMVVDYEF